MNRRAAQVASELHKAVQSILDRGLQDPRLAESLLTVTEVRVGDDLRNATIMVSIMPEQRADLAVHGLKAAAGYIRREAGRLIEIRRLPELVFKLDTSVKKQAEVLQAIARATAEREAAEAQQGHQPQPPSETPRHTPETPPDPGDGESAPRPA